MRKKYCIITNDVETTSILNHGLTKEAGDLVFEQGMPRLLDLYKKYNVKSTFFFCGDIIQQHPNIVNLLENSDHEVASHGWSHEPKYSFDTLSLEQQIEHLKLSKNTLENICKKQIVSFRAPALRVNNDTEVALDHVGFKIDSSISSQRMDMFLSFGSIKKLKWLFAPRRPYFSKSENLFSPGKGNIYEIPVSAIGLGYIGTTLRIWPILTRFLRHLLHWECLITNKPIVFLTHPNEFIDEIANNKKTNRRASNYFSYVLGDLLRRKLKTKNLGSSALPLLEKEIAFFKRKNYEFITCEMYYKIIKDNQNHAGK